MDVWERSYECTADKEYKWNWYLSVETTSSFAVHFLCHFSAPGNLWVDFHASANQTTVTARVSPGKVRYFTLKSEMFVGLKDIQLEVSGFGLSISPSWKTPPLHTGPSILPVKQAEIPLTPLFSKAMCLSDNTMYATKPHLGTKFKTLCRIPRDANWRCFSKIAIA